MDIQSSQEKRAITNLYHQLLDAWNRHSAEDFAALFAEECSVVGFDGSQMNSPAEIRAELGRIFADHATAAYVGRVREVRLLSPECALLRAVSGMIPPGQHGLNPAANTIQALVAVKGGSGLRDGLQDGWRIAHYHNTPAQFHGRPELAEALTNDLRKLLE